MAEMMLDDTARNTTIPIHCFPPVGSHPLFPIRCFSPVVFHPLFPCFFPIQQSHRAVSVHDYLVSVGSFGHARLVEWGWCAWSPPDADLFFGKVWRWDPRTHHIFPCQWWVDPSTVCEQNMRIVSCAQATAEMARPVTYFHF
jgi:hypothetical protein